MGKRGELSLKYERQKRNNTIALFIGLGLILLAGITLFFLPLSKSNNNTNEDGLSAIPAEVNYPAPQLALENINGNTESLTDFNDMVVLVNNWATWCPPCKAEMPTLVAFYNDHAGDGLMVIAVEAGEPREQVVKFTDQYQMPFTVWLDPNGNSLKAFNNGNLPSSYVIDRSGTIRYMWTGQINRAMLEKYITPLLAE